MLVGCVVAAEEEAFAVCLGLAAADTPQTCGQRGVSNWVAEEVGMCAAGSQKEKTRVEAVEVGESLDWRIGGGARDAEEAALAATTAAGVGDSTEPSLWIQVSWESVP